MRDAIPTSLATQTQTRTEEEEEEEEEEVENGNGTQREEASNPADPRRTFLLQNDSKQEQPFIDPSDTLVRRVCGERFANAYFTYTFRKGGEIIDYVLAMTGILLAGAIVPTHFAPVWLLTIPLALQLLGFTIVDLDRRLIKEPQFILINGAAIVSSICFAHSVRFDVRSCLSLVLVMFSLVLTSYDARIRVVGVGNGGNCGYFVIAMWWTALALAVIVAVWFFYRVYTTGYSDTRDTVVVIGNLKFSVLSSAISLMQTVVLFVFRLLLLGAYKGQQGFILLHGKVLCTRINTSSLHSNPGGMSNYGVTDEKKGMGNLPKETVVPASSIARGEYHGATRENTVERQNEGEDDEEGKVRIQSDESGPSNNQDNQHNQRGHEKLIVEPSQFRKEVDPRNTIVRYLLGADTANYIFTLAFKSGMQAVLMIVGMIGLIIGSLACIEVLLSTFALGFLAIAPLAVSHVLFLNLSVFPLLIRQFQFWLANVLTLVLSVGSLDVFKYDIRSSIAVGIICSSFICSSYDAVYIHLKTGGKGSKLQIRLFALVVGIALLSIGVVMFFISWGTLEINENAFYIGKLKFAVNSIAVTSYQVWALFILHLLVLLVWRSSKGFVTLKVPLHSRLVYDNDPA